MLSIVPYTKRDNYNPFRMLDDMDKMFFSDHGIGEFKTDIRDAGEEYVLEADLPGFDKQNIDVSVEDNNLVIRAFRKNVWDEKDTEGKYLRCERAYGSFCRSFALNGVHSDEIKASYENGVLRLRMPKSRSVNKTRKLEIE